MDVFGKDAIIGNIRLSDYGLVLGSFSFDNDNVELGMDMETTESYIGSNPVPVYLGSKHTNKLMPKITIIQNECKTDRIYFTMQECREIISKLMGFQGYVKMYIDDDKYDETMFYNIRFKSASYEKSYDKVIGIIFEGECDSQFAWTEDIINTYITTQDNSSISIYNDSDDLYNYLYPKVEITVSEHTNLDNFVLINNSDDVIDNTYNNENNSIDINGYKTVFKLNNANKIYMDSKKCTISFYNNDTVSNGENDFKNMHFIRLKPGINNFTISHKATIKFTYNLPRKVGLY